ncbi:MAG: hypothetical protein ACI865_001299 [Flavobacteriaceae bacterium]|jgi:hypothetical protein
MMNRIFGEHTHTYLHILGLSGIAFALPWSKALMSISMMFIVLNLLLEADFKSYWTNLKSNRIFWLVALLFFFYIAGMLWSCNMDEALHTFKQKLPFITIPTVLSAKPLKKTWQIDLVLLAFMLPLLFTSLLNFGYYQHWFGDKNYNDIRGMSQFGSHIRYGLLISMGAAIALDSIRRYRKLTIPFLLLLVWFSFYTMYSQVISGIITFSAVVGVYLLYHLWLRTKLLATIFLFICAGIIAASAFWLLKPLSYDASKYENLPKLTSEGNEYEHNFGFISSETGEPVLIYLCEEELETEWEKRSKFRYDGSTINGNPISHTLIRYLSSKYLHRDGEGVKALTIDDIENIEQGCSSVNHSSFMARMHSVRFELNNAEDPNGHSLLQRLEYWKAGLSIAKENWLIGVGSGDAQVAFDAYYSSNDSCLTTKNRRRAHNQFLTFFLTFGVFGLILFVLIIAAFIRYNLKKRQLLGLLFITIATLSFLIEDTLDTQTGVTFFALFFGIYISSVVNAKNDEIYTR